MLSAEIAGHRFDWGSRTYVMGVVNTSPDSFSGDGLDDPETAISQGLVMAGEGAAMLDVGGQSTRPGHEPIGVPEETGRTERAVEALAKRSGVPASTDTYRIEVAAPAADAAPT